MAFATIVLTNGVEVKKAPMGYSWTTLLFGAFPALFRQDWLIAIAMIVANIATYGVAGVVFSFFYNKVYIKSLIAKGYWIKALPAGTDENDLIEYLGVFSLPTPPKQ